MIGFFQKKAPSARRKLKKVSGDKATSIAQPTRRDETFELRAILLLLCFDRRSKMATAGENQRFSKEFYNALKEGLAECAKGRPTDPCKFIAGTPGLTQWHKLNRKFDSGKEAALLSRSLHSISCKCRSTMRLVLLKISFRAECFNCGMVSGVLQRKSHNAKE